MIESGGRVRVANGIDLVLQPLPGANSIVCYGVFPLGVRLERDGESGLFHLCEHLLWSGTRQHPSAAALARAFERVGGMTRGFTSRDMMAIGVQTEPEVFPDILNQCLDLLWDTRLTSEDFIREQSVVTTELRGEEDDYHASVKRGLRMALWGRNHPLGRSVGGTPDSVGNLTYAQVDHVINHLLCPANTTLLVAGRFECEDMIRLVNDAMRVRAPGTPWTGSPRILLEPQPRFLRQVSSETAYLAIGFRVPANCGSRRPVLTVLSSALGEGECSRLYQELRQRRSLAYDLYSQHSSFHDGSELLVYCNVAQERAREALDLVLHELSRLTDLTDEEIAIAKRRVRAHWSFVLESTEEYAYWLALRHAATGEVVPFADWRQALANVTPEEVREVAEAVVSLDAASVAVLASDELLAAFAGPTG